MWDLQILLSGLWDSLERGQSTVCQLCDDNADKSNQNETVLVINVDAARKRLCHPC